ncbi:MAG: hypothetical protein IT376_00100 [Polyangiaceae bacterium]|nr:hypothetical protein [Polyangiaceae bacterium]
MAQGSQFIPPGHQACAKCGRGIDPARALYSNEGDLVCDGCFSTADIAARLDRAARGLAYSTVAAAVFSWICNPFFIVSGIAIVNSVAALRYLVRADVKQALGSSHSTLFVLAILGLAIAGARLLLELAAIGLMMAAG